MVWFVQPFQRKNDKGEPSGMWHLTANSDEGGGFHVGCDHDHASAEEAQDCRDAKIALGTITGFPYRAQIITVNGTQHDVGDDLTITHERICELAGQPVYASVVYFGPRDCDSQRGGTTFAGESIKLQDGLVFNAVVTGSA